MDLLPSRRMGQTTPSGLLRAALHRLRSLLLATLFCAAVLGPASARIQSELLERVQHHDVDSADGVSVHYVTLGEGDPVLMLHGFPDYWYTWRHLMADLEPDYRSIALDLRGYDQSGQPDEVSDYAMPRLLEDIDAVLDDQGLESATVVGHDWGAAIAWQYAMNRPQRVDRLVILSVPHPTGLQRELRENTVQQRDSGYAREFQKQGAEESLTAEGLASWVGDPADRQYYVEAFRRSSFRGMLDYYKANYPRVTPSASISTPPSAPTPLAAAPPAPPLVRCPVLVLHGMKDRALHAEGHAYTWDHVEKDTTLLMIPQAGHFLQHDATELVNGTILDWLARRHR